MSVWDSLHDSRAVEGLARQLGSGEVAHAWLLLGPAGSGKRAAAVAMAASLNCAVEPGVGCAQCSTCARILRARFPDVHHIVPEGPLIPVDVIRESVIPEAARSPFEGRRKVFIIEESERMNPPAQNALLKTLEEPQEDTIFILLSDREEELLETIHSRCRVVRLEAVPEERVAELLVQDGVSEEEALLAARLSDGDLERARTLAMSQDAKQRRSLWSSIPARLLSPVDSLEAAAEIVDTTRSCVKERERSQKAEIAELAEALGEGRGTALARNALAKRHKRELRRLEEEILGEALVSVASFYRDVIAARSGGHEAITNLDRLVEIERWVSSEVGDVDLLRAVERCIEARASLLRNANSTLAIESALVEIAGVAPPPPGERAAEVSG